MKRRNFLRKSITAGGAAAICSAFGMADTQDSAHFVPRAPALAGSPSQNRAPLAPASFFRLPPGSITPKGWVRQQLFLQVEGLNGRLAEISDYLQYENCGWVDPTKDAWEELPYWLRGFGDLGYVTGDERVLTTTRKWIDGILATGQPDGWFGPTKLRTSLEGGPDFWPGMPLLDTLRSFEEFTGDTRVVPFLTRYFRLQNEQPPGVFNRGWGKWRWGDNIDSVYWLYNRTGEKWLLDLVRNMHRYSADYVSGIPTWHNVNIAQGFREPAQYSVLDRDPKFLEATYRNYDLVMQKYGQFPGGGFAGDENCRPGYTDPRQGFETCGIVEFMHSFQMLTRMTGDPIWADRCEDLAFNSMPAAFDQRQKSIHYITCANSVQLDRNEKKAMQFDNKFAMLAYMPGIHNYRCCPHNYGMGWPYYAEELWVATSDGGLCASLYAASEVKTKLAGGAAVHIVEETGYPFEEMVRLSFKTADSLKFPLYLRVPRWCSNPAVEVNGTPVSVSATGPGYIVLNRTWRVGDSVSLRLPMRVSMRKWAANHDSISVDRGPITFSLGIEERWSRFGGTNAFPEFEVHSGSPWNYGLVLDNAHPEKSFAVNVASGPVPVNPFTRHTVPVTLTANARKLEAWQADSEGVVGTVPQSPVKTTSPVETVTLIPMGAARLRITSFPTASTEDLAQPPAPPAQPKAPHHMHSHEKHS